VVSLFPSADSGVSRSLGDEDLVVRMDADTVTRPEPSLDPPPHDLLEWRVIFIYRYSRSPG